MRGGGEECAGLGGRSLPLGMLTLMAASTKGEVALLTTPCSSSLAATMVLTCAGGEEESSVSEPDATIYSS